MAKAVATEAQVPFLAMAGSEFVEVIGGEMMVVCLLDLVMLDSLQYLHCYWVLSSSPNHMVLGYSAKYTTCSCGVSEQLSSYLAVPHSDRTYVHICVIGGHL